ncbi:hypothetical protein [Rickettsiella endosymbiont of Miltochrista miniata]|uniref:hypothetical protein n=1 Tax=Rickettsiella endosymbiont of Miltochrista miniata TaxID=3066239 RepID=UPI00313A95EA
MPKISKKTHKDLYNFSLLNKLENHGGFSHDVFLTEKIKNGHRKSIWYIKYLGSNRNEAIIETLAQEFYRLIYPQQPKTRRAISKTKTGMLEYHVLSKKISDFNEQFFLFPKNHQLVLDRGITGLPTVQALALCTNEVDLKAGNVGVDAYGHVIKIDGGLSFIKLNPRFKYLHEGKNLDITQADLEALPNLVNYEACNWLQQIQWSLKKKRAIKKEPTELDKKINQSPDFKNELYQTILRIISLPDELIQFFTQSYIANGDDVKRFSGFIIARKLQLALAAEQIPAFNKYRQSNRAREEIVNFLKYLRNFKTMRKSFLLSEFEDQYKMNIEAIILRNMTQEFTLKNFTIELDGYDRDLSKAIHDEINFKILINENFKLDLDRIKLHSEIEVLKKDISKYLTLPATLKDREELSNILKNVVDKLKKDFVMEKEQEHSVISNLIKSIKQVVSVNDNSKKIKKPIPTPRKNAQPLPSMGFFNQSHQKVSEAYHQHDMDHSPNNSALHKKDILTIY